MVWITVGSKGQDLALNNIIHSFACISGRIASIWACLPGNNFLLQSCASVSSFSIKTADIKSGTRKMAFSWFPVSGKFHVVQA